MKYLGSQILETERTLLRPTIETDLYILWKIFDDWPNKFTLSKKMIFIKRINDLRILNNIDLLQKCHNNLNEISKEISSIVF